MRHALPLLTEPATTMSPVAAVLAVLVLAALGAVLAVPAVRRRHARFAGTAAQLQRVAGDSRVGDVLPAGRGRRGNGRTPIPGAALQVVVASLPAARLVDLVGEDHPVSGTGRHRRGLRRPRPVAGPAGYWTAYLAGVELPVSTGAGERFFATSTPVPAAGSSSQTSAQSVTAPSTDTEAEMSEPAAPLPARPAVPAQRTAPGPVPQDAAGTAPDDVRAAAGTDAGPVPARSTPAPAGTRRGRLSLPFLSRSSGRSAPRAQAPVMAPRPPAALRPDLAVTAAAPAAEATSPVAPEPPAAPSPEPAGTPDTASPVESTATVSPSEDPMTTPAEQSGSRWFDDEPDLTARLRRPAPADGEANGWWNAPAAPAAAEASTPLLAPAPAPVPTEPRTETPRPAGRQVAIVDIGVAPVVRALHEPVVAPPAPAVVEPVAETVEVAEPVEELEPVEEPEPVVPVDVVEEAPVVEPSAVAEPADPRDVVPAVSVDLTVPPAEPVVEVEPVAEPVAEVAPDAEPQPLVAPEPVPAPEPVAVTAPVTPEPAPEPALQSADELAQSETTPGDATHAVPHPRGHRQPSNRQRQVLRDASRRLEGPTDRFGIAQVATEETLSLVEADIASLVVRSVEGPRVLRQDPEGLGIWGGKTLAALMNLGRPLRKVIEGDPLSGGGQTALLVVPVPAGGTVAGTLIARRTSGRAFSPAEQDCLERLARMAGAALDTAARRGMLLGQGRLDSVTGLAHRERLLEDLRAALITVQTHGMPTSLIAAEVTGLGALREAEGRPAADEAVAAVAAAVQGTLRVGDVPYRFGVDELAVMLPATSEQDAPNAAARLEEAVNALRLRPAGHAIALRTAVVAVTGVAEDVVFRAIRALAASDRPSVEA